MQRRLSEEQIASISEEFHRLDPDGDGAISREELRAAMEAAGHQPSAAEIDRELARADLNHDGAITLKEWLHMWSVAILGADPDAS